MQILNDDNIRDPQTLLAYGKIFTDDPLGAVPQEIRPEVETPETLPDQTASAEPEIMSDAYLTRQKLDYISRNLSPDEQGKLVCVDFYKHRFGVDTGTALFMMDKWNTEYFGDISTENLQPNVISPREAAARIMQLPEYIRARKFGKINGFLPDTTVVQSGWRRSEASLKPGEIPAAHPVLQPAVESTRQDPPLFPAANAIWIETKRVFGNIAHLLAESAAYNSFTAADMADPTAAAERIQQTSDNIQDSRRKMNQNLDAESAGLRQRMVSPDWDNKTIGDFFEKHGAMATFQHLAAVGNLLGAELIRYMAESAVFTPLGVVAVETANTYATETDRIQTQHSDISRADAESVALARAGVTALTYLIMPLLMKSFAPKGNVGGTAVIGTPEGTILAEKIAEKTSLKVLEPAAREFFAWQIGTVFRKSAIDYVIRSGGAGLSNAALQGAARLVQNMVDIEFGLKEENQIFDNVGKEALHGGLFALWLFTKNYITTPGKIIHSEGYVEGNPIAGTTPHPPQKLLTWSGNAKGYVPPAVFRKQNVVLNLVELPESNLPRELSAVRPAALGNYSPEFLRDAADAKGLTAVVEENMLSAAAGLPVQRLRVPGSSISTVPENPELTDLEKAKLYFQDRKTLLAHDPQETCQAVDAVRREFPHIKITVVNSGADFPAEVVDDLAKLGRTPQFCPAYYSNGEIIVNAAVMRPAEVSRLVVKHELFTHDGIRRMMNDADRRELLEIIAESHQEELERFAASYGYAADSDRAVEEFIASRMEFEGNDPAKLFELHKSDITRFAEENRLPFETEQDFIEATKRFFDAGMADLPKVAWYDKFIAWLRNFIRRFTSLSFADFTDNDFRKLFRDLGRNVRKNRAVKGNNGGKRFDVNTVSKLNHSRYQENTMLSGDAEIPVVTVESVFKTVDTVEKELTAKIKNANGKLVAVNKDQNMSVLIQSNNSLDEASSEKAINETLSDGTPAEIHAAALANIEPLLTEARLGVSHRDWHVHAKNQQRGQDKETALRIHRFYVAMQYDSDIFGVKMTVREKRNGATVFYTIEAHELDIQKINPETNGIRGGVVKAALPGRSPVVKYSTFFEKFNPIDDLLGFKYKEKYPDVRFSIGGENKKSSTVARSSTGLSQSFPDYRGLGGNAKSIATAALQSVEHDYKIAPKSNKVNRYFKEVKDVLSGIQNGNPVFIERLLKTLLNMGFAKYGRGSVYLEVNDLSTIRLSNHTSNAVNFTTTGKNASNVSLVLRSAITGDKKFESDANVNLLELQFGKKFIDQTKISILLADIAHFLSTGEYIDNVGALKFEISGNKNFKTKVLDNLYFSAINRGDMKTAEKLVNAAHDSSIYKTGSTYQGSLAFNGAAPAKNGNYESKEARKAAWDSGDYEGEFSLGDFVDNGIDTHDLKWQLTDPTAKRIADDFGKESIRNLQKAIKNPDRTIRIYRAVDANIQENSIRNGDWITPSRSYAEQHIELQDWESGRIIEQEVSIDDIWWNGDDINEWGYDDGKNYAYANTPNSRKLLDIVTYDNDGNIIPLSQRFDPKKSDPRYSLADEYYQMPNEMREMLAKAAKEWAAKNYYSTSSPDECLKFFKDAGLPVETAETADRLMHDAMELAKKGNAEARKKKAWDYYRENNPLFDFVMDFVGENGLVNPGKRFEGIETTSSFFDPKYNQWNVKQPQGKKSDKQYWRWTQQRLNALAQVRGVGIDEIANAYVDTFGESAYGDALAVEEQIFKMLRDLKCKDITSAYSDHLKELKAENEYWEEQAAKEYEAELMNLAEKIIHTQNWPEHEFVKNNPKVIKKIYEMVTHQTAPDKLSQKELLALEAAVRSQGEDKRAFYEAFKVATALARDEFRQKLADFKEKLKAGNINARELIYDAKDFLFRNVPSGFREKFMSRVMGLEKFSTEPSVKYPDGARKAKFDELLADMVAFSREVRSKELLDRIFTRLDQVHTQVDTTRKVVGVRNITIQQELDYIYQIARLPQLDLDEETAAVQAALDNTAEPAAAADLEHQLAAIHLFGNLQSKSPEELGLALKCINDLARTGRNMVFDAIAARRAGDKKAVDFIVRHVTSDKGLKTKIQKDNESHEKDPGVWSSWSIFKMEDFVWFLSANKYNGDWLTSPTGEIFKDVHRSQVRKDELLRRFSELRNSALARFIGKDKIDPVQAAEVLQKLRTPVEHTGIFRHAPDDPKAREVHYISIPVDAAREIVRNEAKRKNAEVSGTDKDGTPVTIKLDDFQLDFLEQRLESLALRMAKTYKRKSIDGVTEDLYSAADSRDRAADYKTVAVPVVTYKEDANLYEMESLSQLDALYYHLMWQQKSPRYQMAMNGFTADTIRALERFLLPETKALGDQLVSFLDEMGNEMDVVMRDLYFSALPRVENYFPAVYEHKKSGDTGPTRVDLDAKNGSNQTPGLVPGSLKKRNAHILEPKKCDALTVFENAVLRNAHWVAFAQVARKMRGVFLAPDAVAAMEQTFGTGFVEQFRQSIIDTINGGKLDEKYNKWLQNLYSNSVATKMMFNLVSGIKQTVGWISYVNDVPAKAVLRGIAEAMHHPKTVVAILKSSPYFKNRLDNGADMWLKMMIDQNLASTSKISGFNAIVKKWAALFTRYGDAMAVVLGGYGVYKYHYDRMIARNFTHEEAHKEALLRFEMSTESLQQSNAMHNRNAWQRDRHMKMFTAWRSNQILQGQRAAREIVAMKFFGRKTGLSKDVKSYSEYLDEQVAKGVMKAVTPQQKKDLLKFYKKFPLGKEIVNRFGEVLIFAPDNEFKLNDYIQHFAVKRVEVKGEPDKKVEKYSENMFELFSYLEETLKNPDDRYLTFRDGSERIIYTKEIQFSTSGKHFIVAKIDESGRILNWTHMIRSDNRIAKTAELEKRLFVKYGVEDINGERVYISYDEYLNEKKKRPLYLATATRQQQGYPQTELVETDINISPENKKSRKFYSGTEKKFENRLSSALNTIVATAAVSTLCTLIDKVWENVRNKDDDEWEVDDLLLDFGADLGNNYLAVFPIISDIVDLRRLLSGRSFGSQDKTMFITDIGRSIGSLIKIYGHISDELWHRAFDDVARILQSLGVFREEFALGGSLLYRANQFYKIFSDNNENSAQPATGGRRRRRRRRQQR